MPKPPAVLIPPSDHVAKPKRKVFAFAVIHEEDGTWRPVRLEIQGSQVMRQERVGDPGPYMAIAYQALEAAVSLEYLRHQSRLGGK